MSQIKRLWEFQENLSDLEPRDFEDLIYESVQQSFPDISFHRNSELQDLGFDIQGEGDNKKYLLEIKRRKSVGIDEIRKLGFLWGSEKQISNAEIILVVSGTLTKEASEEAKKWEIDVWDVYKLYNLVPQELREKYFYGSIQQPEFIKREDKYISVLQSIKSGGEDWQQEWTKYQKAVSDILEYLFCPPLEPPRFEISDLENKNRRDIIFENSSETGFWKQIRNVYSGDYIVVDAKNYKEPIKKRSIIEIAHYLKPYGCGLFGIVVSREEESESSFYARKEQWIGNKKMVISLDDKDLVEMLEIKRKGGKTEEIIRRKIADFRMKL